MQSDLIHILSPLPDTSDAAADRLIDSIIDDLQVEQSVRDLGLLNLAAGRDTMLKVARVCAAARPSIERLHRLCQQCPGRFMVEELRQHRRDEVRPLAKLLLKGYDYWSTR